MKKVLILPLLLVLFLVTSCTNNINKTTNTSKISTSKSTTVINNMDSKIILDSYINEMINNTKSYIPYWNKEGFKGKWNYIDGVFLKSIIDYYKKTNEDKYIEFVKNYVNYYINKNGEFLNIKDSNQAGFANTELDSICESRILFDLYDKYKDDRYLTAIETTYTALSNMPIVEGSSNYWHKTSYENQIWLDGMYMYGPFLAKYALYKNDNSLIDLLKNQYSYIEFNMKDNNTGLYYHGYDSTKSIFWANNTTGCSSSFWLRSMGWFIVSLVDVIDIIPDSNNRSYLINLFKNTIDDLLKYQDNNSKMFYQVIDKANLGTIVSYEQYLKPLNNNKYNKDTTIKNYLESSGSSMVAYSLMKASNINIIDKSYYEKGLEIFKGTYNHSFSNNSLNDICITAGLGPANRLCRDGSFEYYLAEPVGSNDAKGVGPFIMAYINM